jgi:tetratricopeptide (TPR) repeat protein
VSKVADQLSQQLGRERVFYDEYSTAELARPELDLYLGNIYRNESDLIVPFFCAEYERKKWCKLEWRQMRDILFNLEGDRIMPFRFDDTPVDGVLSIDGYVAVEELSPEEVAELILQRLGAPTPARASKPKKTPADFLLSNTREAPKATNPATLLNARYEVVSFFADARTRELDDLKAWCDSEEPATGVRLFYGPGGTGKTRLLIEWAKQLREQGWYAGFLPENVEDDQIERLLHTDRPTLVVLDYAECRGGLFELLKRLAERPADQKQRLRIVLLARDVGDWWNSLRQRDEAVGHLLAEYEPTLVAPVTLEGDLRQRVWEHARDAFVTCLDSPAPPVPANLKDERFGRVLYLHMSALAAVEGRPTEAASLLEEILTHEKHFWTKRYREQFGDDDFEAAEFLKRCSRLVAAVTLHGGAPSREAAEELSRQVEGPDPRYKHLVPFLRSLYPGRGQAQDRYLGGLEPDLLGEALVRAVLSDPETAPDTFLERVFAGADDLALQNGFVVLGRISLQDAPVAEPWLAGLLDLDVSPRAGAAFRAALALGARTAFCPLGQILARALEREGTLDHAAEFDSLVPEETVSLRELGVWTACRILDFLSSQPETEKNTVERARLQNNLGNRLSDLGRREEALGAAQEAVEIYRRLAESRPDAFLPYLATSLNNLGTMLSDLGRREEALAAAQEAVEIYRRLAESRPETFLPDLARSLGVLGTCLAGSARLREAVEAFAEGVRTLQPAFSKLPHAFGPLMVTLVGLYLEHAKELGEAPDMDMLGPIVAKLEEDKDGS